MKETLIDYQVVEKRRQAIQVELDAERTAVERNQLGQFCTPNALAREIARFILGEYPEFVRRIRFADPSIGTGSFYSSALSEFGLENIEFGMGVELDPRFAAAARDLWEKIGLEVIEGDFTRLFTEGVLPASPNLILANPPYVRHHHLERGQKERLQAIVREHCNVNVNGLAGLYVYFVLLSTEWMEKGGIAAWLIPSEFMDVNYGSVLRDYFTEQVTLDRIHRFDPKDVQFDDALVSSAIVIIRKSTPDCSHEVRFTFGGTLDVPAASDRISLKELRSSRKWTIYPRHEENDRRICSSIGQARFSDFFRIQRGIATGCNKFFILNRKEASDRGLPEAYLRPILPSPRHLKETVIEADEEGYPIVEPQLCVIDCDLSENEVREHHPSLWEYLRTAEERGIRNGYLLKKRSPWYKQERRDPAPFLCTYMGRGTADKQPFRFIWNRSHAISTNLYLMLTPHKSLASMLKRHPERMGDLFSLLGRITGDELRGEGRVYGGGLNKIEPRELGRISAALLIERWPELGETLRKSETQSLFS